MFALRWVRQAFYRAAHAGLTDLLKEIQDDEAITVDFEVTTRIEESVADFEQKKLEVL